MPSALSHPFSSFPFPVFRGPYCIQYHSHSGSSTNCSLFSADSPKHSATEVPQAPPAALMQKWYSSPALGHALVSDETNTPLALFYIYWPGIISSTAAVLSAPEVP